MDIPNLRAIRLGRLMTQADLAGASGLTKATISRLETGATKARISTIRGLAKALKVDPAELLGNNEAPHTSTQEGSNT